MVPDLLGSDRFRIASFMAIYSMTSENEKDAEQNRRYRFRDKHPVTQDEMEIEALTDAEIRLFIANKYILDIERVVL